MNTEQLKDKFPHLWWESAIPPDEAGQQAFFRKTRLSSTILTDGQGRAGLPRGQSCQVSQRQAAGSLPQEVSLLQGPRVNPIDAEKAAEHSVTPSIFRGNQG